MEKKVTVKSLSCVRLFVTPWTAARQAQPSMGFSRQEYWSGLPFPSPGDLPESGIDLGSPALRADAFSSEPPGISKGWKSESQFWHVVVKVTRVVSGKRSLCRRSMMTAGLDRPWFTHVCWSDGSLGPGVGFPWSSVGLPSPARIPDGCASAQQRVALHQCQRACPHHPHDEYDWMVITKLATCGWGFGSLEIQQLPLPCGVGQQASWLHWALCHASSSGDGGKSQRGLREAGFCDSVRPVLREP